MKRLITVISLFLSLTSLTAQTENPVADPSAVITSGKARFTVLTPEMIRIQYSDRNLFEDRATFAIINRRLPVPQFSTTEQDGWLTIKTSALTLKYKIGGKISGTTSVEYPFHTQRKRRALVSWKRRCNESERYYPHIRRTNR